jgi:hypothetical protein
MPNAAFKKYLESMFNALSKGIETDLKQANNMNSNQIGKILFKIGMLVKNLYSYIIAINKLEKEFFVSDLKIGILIFCSSRR